MFAISDYFRKKEQDRPGAGCDSALSSFEFAGDSSGISIDDDALWYLTFDAVDDVISIHDTEMRCLKANRAARQFLDIPEEEIEGRTCHDLFACSDEPCSTCPARFLTSKNEIHTSEVEIKKNGKIFLVTCSPIVVDKAVKAFVRVGKDITRQKRLEKQLIQAQKMESIATLAGGIGHDFNNILGAILGNTDLLLYRISSASRESRTTVCEQEITFPEIEDHLLAIKTAGNRAKGLITQIQAFSRQTSSQKLDVDITPVIKETIKLLRSSLPATLELKSSIDPNVGLIHADPTQIQQVVMNLCTNGAQAMQEKGGCLSVEMKSITIGTTVSPGEPELQPGEYVMLSIQDTGIGMAEEIRARIFDPFFTTRELGTGTGMGLAVIHGIVKSHGGVIDVQSEENEGSFFRIYFPKSVKEDDAKEVDIVSNMVGGDETILLVDDENALLKMRSKMLKYLGYNVLTATNGLDAYTLFKEQSEKIDIIITDNTMPLMTGVQLCREIAKVRKVPIILCSGLSNSMCEQEAEEAGISKIFQKPLNINTLARTIREVL